MVLVMIFTVNYLIDSYVIHAASVLAANLVLRSIFGALFPLISLFRKDHTLDLYMCYSTTLSRMTRTFISIEEKLNNCHMILRR